MTRFANNEQDLYTNGNHTLILLAVNGEYSAFARLLKGPDRAVFEYIGTWATVFDHAKHEVHWGQGHYYTDRDSALDYCERKGR